MLLRRSAQIGKAFRHVGLNNFLGFAAFQVNLADHRKSHGIVVTIRSQKRPFERLLEIAIKPFAARIVPTEQAHCRGRLSISRWIRLGAATVATPHSRNGCRALNTGSGSGPAGDSEGGATLHVGLATRSAGGARGM